MRTKSDQIARVLKVMAMLQNTRSGLSTSEIKSQLENDGHSVSLRTIYRDIDALTVAGLMVEPIEEISDSGAQRFKITITYRRNDN